MTHACYVLGAWGVTLLACSLYAAILIVRGRRLCRRVEYDSPSQRQ